MNEQIQAQLLASLERLPNYLGQHIQISVLSLAIGLAISLPLAVWATRSRSLRWAAITVASIIQTIPSIALLALFYPVLVAVSIGTRTAFGLDFSPLGFLPTIMALTLYSMLPILRNTVTGIANVDPDVREAAQGMGMTPRQVLWTVELPLALPVIVAGVRTATVWVVGIATLSTPIGQTSLGNYIFPGLQTEKWITVLFGCVCAAGLAMALDLLIGGLERAAVKRSRPMAVWSASLLGALVVVGLLLPMARPWLRQTFEADRRQIADQARQIDTLRVGAKTFTEQYILAELIGTQLREHGFHVERVEGLGSSIGFNALTHSDIDVYVDYSGTIWANYMKRQDTPPAWQVTARVIGWLAREHGVRTLGSLGFEDAYALAMRREQARKLGIQTIGDLAEHAPEMVIGGDFEFFQRPEWHALRDAYGLNFARQKQMQSTFMYKAVAGGEVDVISAFSSDGRIAAYDLVVIEDNREVIPPYDALLLLSPRVAASPDVAEALRPLVDSIDLETMQQANMLVDAQNRSIAAAAQWLGEQIEQPPVDAADDTDP